MSNDELRKVNERQRLESQYRQNNSKTRYISKGLKAVTATAGIIGSIYTIYDKGPKLVSAGKKVVNKIRRKR